MNHVKDLRAALGSNAVAMPELNLGTAFTAAAQAAGIIGANDTFSPVRPRRLRASLTGQYSSDAYFLLGAFLFEDAGVTAYNGAAPLIQNKDVLAAAAGILAAEAYHGGVIRASCVCFSHRSLTLQAPRCWPERARRHRRRQQGRRCRGCRRQRQGASARSRHG